MNASKFLAVSLFAVAAAGASVASFADEADASQYVVQFDGTRTRADVRAEAVAAAGDRSQDLAALGAVQFAGNSSRSAVKAEAVAAVGDRSQELAAMGVTTMRSTTTRAAVRADITAAKRAGQFSSSAASE